jgi:peptidoglycan/LPS O-acetylase OafA/YrhL
VGYYSVAPYLVGMGVILTLVSTPLFRWADSPPGLTPGRTLSLDGLRGILAMSVFFHHAAIYHAFLETGAWVTPPSRLYTLLGQGGVALFFMITGYLFWSRLVQGRGKPNWLSLYTGRVFRLGPLYLFAIGVMCLIIASRTGWRLHPPGLHPLPKWLMLGFFQGGDINGYPRAVILLAWVTWTLRYEWLFYLSLPLLALVARRPHVAVAAAVFVVGLILVGLRNETPMASIATFGAGMLAGSLREIGFRNRLPEWATVLLVVMLLAVIGLCSTAYSPLALIGLTGVFLLISGGGTLFGLLTSRAAVRLGDISFGVYLLQGLVLTLFFQDTPLAVSSLRSPEEHWAFMLVAALSLLLVATVTHVMIERPGIALGKGFARTLTRWVARSDLQPAT